MKRKSSTLVYIATALVVIGVIVSSFAIVDYASIISTVTTTVTAIIGAVALYIQFKKDKEVNQQSFIIEFAKQFYDPYDCSEIFRVLDNTTRGIDFEYSQENAFSIVRGLEWCEALAGMVRDDVVTIESVDNLCSYRFFLFANNRQIQDNEILPYREFYVGVIWLHEKWTEYKRKHNLPIVNDADNLTDRLKREALEPAKIDTTISQAEALANKTTDKDSTNALLVNKAANKATNSNKVTIEKKTAGNKNANASKTSKKATTSNKTAKVSASQTTKK